MPTHHTHYRKPGRDRAVCGAIGGSSDAAHVTCPKCMRATVGPCDDEDADGHMVRLARRCRLVESRGVEVNTSTALRADDEVSR